VRDEPDASTSYGLWHNTYMDSGVDGSAGPSARARSERRAPGATRLRMVDSAAVLLGARGVAGVTVDAVLAHSGAPRGSVYHHFPSGRDELLLAGLDRAGEVISAKLDRALEQGDPHAAVASFVRFWKRLLISSDFRAGCGVVAVVVDSRPDVPEAVEGARAIFDRWHVGITDLLVADGYAPSRAERLATMMVAAVEGAIVLCRAHGDVAPLDAVAAEIDLLLDAR
jgi:TetR/AcrR family transcriptional regulator, lmrAB and yxaGH operons repressor